MTANNKTMNEEVDIKLTANLFLIFGVTLMAVMGVSSIAPAFPSIRNELGLTKVEIGFIISSFTIPGVLLAPFMGVLADRWGRKKVLIPALFLFGAAGGACSLSGSFRMLLLLRFFQGIGASSLGTIAPTILGDLYGGKQRTIVMGYNASALSIGTASYPLIGGALAMFGWRFPFLLPLTAIPLGLCMLFLKNPEPHNHQSFGIYIGNVLNSIKRMETFGVFLIGIATFIILYGCYLMFIPILLDELFHISPFTIGMIISCSSIATAITSSQIKRMVKRVNEKVLLRLGFFLYALAMISVPFIHTLWGFIFPVIVFGIGMGVNIPCLISILASLAPIEHRAAFMSLNSMMVRIGQTLGPIMMGFVVVIWGTTGVFTLGAVLALIMVFVVAVTLR